MILDVAEIVAVTARCAAGETAFVQMCGWSSLGSARGTV